MRWLTKWEPRGTQLPSLGWRELDRWFEDSFGPGFWGAAETYPKVNVDEDEEAFHVIAQAPGVDKEALVVTVQDNVLTIAGERKDEKYEGEHKDATRHRRELRVGRFQRSLALPADVDVEKIEATYADGELRIRLPKAESARPKVIEVKVG